MISRSRLPLNNRSPKTRVKTSLAVREFECAEPVGNEIAHGSRKRGKERVLYDQYESMFRTNPVAFLFCLALVPFLVGLVAICWWRVKTWGTRVTVTNRRTILRRGVLARHTNEVMHSDVRNIQIRKSLFERVMGTGELMISSAGQGQIEISVRGIPHPSKIRHLIDQFR